MLSAWDRLRTKKAEKKKADAAAEAETAKEIAENIAYTINQIRKTHEAYEDNLKLFFITGILGGILISLILSKLGTSELRVKTPKSVSFFWRLLIFVEGPV